MMEVLKVWVILGLLTAVWFVAELPDIEEPDEEFYQCTVTIVKTVVIWPWSIYQAWSKHE